MKRRWRIFWIVCAVCAGIGLMCCSAAFVMGVTVEMIEERYPDGIGFISNRVASDDRSDYDNDYDDIEDIDDNEDLYDDYSGNHGNRGHGSHHATAGGTNAVTNKGNSKNIVSGTGMQDFTGVDSIDAYMWGGTLEVDNEAVSSDTISIETDNISKRLGLRCYMDGNELKLVTKKKVVGIRNKKAGRVMIHIPSNYQFKEADLELVAGHLHIGDICADELSVDVGAGEGVVENFTAAEVNLNCGAGSLTAAGIADAEADIDCGVGEIAYTAWGRETDYNYEIDCGIGEIVCGEAAYSGIGGEKTINNSAAKHMDISCGIGSVAVNFTEM